MIRRLAIIDHETHTLFVEDVDENIIETEYNGEEEAYIRDNFACAQKGDGCWSWDYIVEVEYIPNDDDKTPYDIDFENIV